MSSKVISNLSNLLGAYGSGAYSSQVQGSSAIKQTSSTAEVFICSKPIDDSAVEGNGRCIHCHDGKCLMMGGCEFKFKEGDIW